MPKRNTARRSRDLIDWEDFHIDPLSPKTRARLHHGWPRFKDGRPQKTVRRP